MSPQSPGVERAAPSEFPQRFHELTESTQEYAGQCLQVAGLGRVPEQCIRVTRYWKYSCDEYDRLLKNVLMGVLQKYLNEFKFYTFQIR